MERTTKVASCWGDSRYGATRPTGKNWTHVEIQTTNDAFCRGHSSYGGTCPTGKMWTYVEIHSSTFAFLAVDRTRNDAFCWEYSSYGGTCPTDVEIHSLGMLFWPWIGRRTTPSVGVIPRMAHQLKALSLKLRLQLMQWNTASATIMYQRFRSASRFNQTIVEHRSVTTSSQRSH
jgi:hypothetical protein